MSFKSERPGSSSFRRDAEVRAGLAATPETRARRAGWACSPERGRLDRARRLQVGAPSYSRVKNASLTCHPEQSGAGVPFFCVGIGSQAAANSRTSQALYLVR